MDLSKEKTAYVGAAEYGGPAHLVQINSRFADPAIETDKHELSLGRCPHTVFKKLNLNLFCKVRDTPVIKYQYKLVLVYLLSQYLFQMACNL